MVQSRIRITGARITPIAFVDPPLLNTVGVHQPYTLRAIIEVVTDAGLVGLGETYADETHLARLPSSRRRHQRPRRVRARRDSRSHRRPARRRLPCGRHGRLITAASAVDQVLSPFEVACLDALGKALGLPVHALLGGKVRDAVEYSAYLFYKWAGTRRRTRRVGRRRRPRRDRRAGPHLHRALRLHLLQAQGRRLPPGRGDRRGQGARRRLPRPPAAARPQRRHGPWRPPSRWPSELRDVLEYLEDPATGVPAMAEVAAKSGVPLATNMCVTTFDEIKEAFTQGAVQVVLSDHHYWGGLATPSNSPPSAVRSASECRCTPTPTSASASPP